MRIWDGTYSSRGLTGDGIRVVVTDLWTGTEDVESLVPPTPPHPTPLEGPSVYPETSFGLTTALSSNVHPGGVLDPYSGSLDEGRKLVVKKPSSNG